MGTVGKDASDAPREELQGALRLVHSEAQRRYLARNRLHLTAAEEVESSGRRNRQKRMHRTAPARGWRRHGGS